MDLHIAVIGKGGREHALVDTLARSSSDPRIRAWPGSDAIFTQADPIDGVSDVDSLVAALKREDINLVVAGEESYLMLGLADACAKAGIKCWGPVRAAAQLEGSKEFAKEFMLRHDIPTAGYSAASNFEEARAALGKYPVVLKFDGLAAGKGVAVCQTEAEAVAFLEEIYVTNRFGDGGVLVEECLEGPEVSIICGVCDDDYQIYTPARDYKRLGDGDAGPNTGGMGAVATRALITNEILAEIDETVVKPTVAGLIADGLPYRGFLYFGLMLTADGPKMLEYNCRFGDPECQAVLSLAEGDFAAYLDAAAGGSLRPDLLTFSPDWAVCLVSASAGYPASSRNGDRISGLGKIDNARVYHAGTRKNEAGQFETNGGRVLAVVARGEDRESAASLAYSESAKITFDGLQQRSDIARMHF